jgi:hypothetical protein
VPAGGGPASEALTGPTWGGTSGQMVRERGTASDTRDSSRIELLFTLIHETSKDAASVTWSRPYRSLRPRRETKSGTRPAFAEGEPLRWDHLTSAPALAGAKCGHCCNRWPTWCAGAGQEIPDGEMFIKDTPPPLGVLPGGRHRRQTHVHGWDFALRKGRTDTRRFASRVHFLSTIKCR